ncbi:MAG TPA: nuclear transport factor 2 family protein [Methyloceanibacter sp.]|nr:nuclear transport factor 2 family protein [Methyloceanibacter sp.]
MRNLAAIFLSLSVVAATALLEARAGDAETIAEVNEAAAALDQAFEEQNFENVKKLMSSDHVAVTPYYSGPQGVDSQIASLPDLKFEQEITGEVEVSLIGDDAALRTFKAKQRGSFKGRPIPKHVFVSQLMVKQDGAWVERFYQVTALVPRKLSPKQRLACRYPIGTYLTKNKPKGESGDSFTSRSLLSLGSAHLALFTDSGEGGETGFAPFTGGRGNWYCRPGDDGKLNVKATTLDFTAPEAGGQQGGIGRLDFDLTFDIAGKTLGGTATLYLLPLGGDPLDASALKDGREFEISGQSIGAPDR